MQNAETENPGAQILTTSLVVKYDGTDFAYIRIPVEASLNDVLKAIDTAFGETPSPSTKTSQITVYDGDLMVDCIEVMAGLGLNEILSTLAQAICSNRTLATDGGAVIPADSELLLHQLPEADPDHAVPVITGIVPQVLPVEGYVDATSPTTDTKEYNPTDNTVAGHLEGLKEKEGFNDNNIYQRVPYEYLRSTLKSLMVDWCSTKGAVTTSGVSLTGSIAKSNYYISGRRLYVGAAEFTMAALSDNYLDVSYDGIYTIKSGVIGGIAPALSANSMRLYKFVTDASGVTTTVDMVNVYALNENFLSDSSIKTRHLTALNVTNAKLDEVLTQAAGAYLMPEITLLKTGRISNVVSKVVLTSVANKQLLWWDSATEKFVNISKIGDLLPSGNNNDILMFSTGSGDYFTASLADVLEANGIERIYTDEITIASADVLTMGVTPIDLVAAPGASKELVLVDATGKITYNTTAYTTNTTIQIITQSGNAQASDAWLLKKTSSQSSRFTMAGTYASAAESNVAENKKLQALVSGGNPAAGDSDIKLFFKWYVQDL